MTSPAPRLLQLVEKWHKNADMLAEGNKDEHLDPAVAMQRACADELSALVRDPKSPSKPLEQLLKAAKQADWEQVRQNGGPPCFFLEGESFCLRAQRWEGHGASPRHDHPFITLESALSALVREQEPQPNETLADVVALMRQQADDVWHIPGHQDCGRAFHDFADRVARVAVEGKL